MRRIVAIVLAAFAIMHMAPGKAEAGIPIPCTGETVVLVKELPPQVQIPTRNGKVHIDLGYKFSGCFSGEWVGYPGPGGSYYPIPEKLLTLMVVSSGMKEFPRPPSFLMTFSASWPVWLWVGILGLGIIFGRGKWAGAGDGAPVAGAATGAASTEPSLGGGARMSVARAAPAAGLRNAASGPSGRTAFGKRR